MTVNSRLGYSHRLPEAFHAGSSWMQLLKRDKETEWGTTMLTESLVKMKGTVEISCHQ
jgi:hypothetical protein